MKYQIYLNKDTSRVIERIAEVEGVKANTLIKKIVESIIFKASEAALNMTKDIFTTKAKGEKNGE